MTNSTVTIAATLDAQPLCQQIVLFLLENEAAMDTSRGIATWWVGSDEIAVQDALGRLIACGVVTAHTLTSGTLYGLTRNQEVRTWLRATYASVSPRPRAGLSSLRGLGSPLLVLDAPADAHGS